MLKKILILCLCFLYIPEAGYAFSTSAGSTVLINADTRQVLYADNAKEKRGMASTTKIMTAIVALENGNTTDVFTVSENAQNQEGSSIYLRTGEKVTLSDLLYGLMLNSGNDAAIAIAEGVAGDVDYFVNMMNEKARELGCTDTHFANPNGLDDGEHYSTAYDMAIIMSYAMKNEEFRNIVATREHQIKTESAQTFLRNHNKLLWQYEYCIGGKTGYTKATGRCFVSCAQKDGIQTVAVTLDDREDWKDHIALHNFGFDKLKMVNVTEKNDILCTRTVRGERVNILAEDTFSLALDGGRKGDVVCKIHISESVNDGINYGTSLGFGEIFVGDYPVGRIGLISGSVVKKPLKNVFYDTFSHVMSLALLK